MSTEGVRLVLRGTVIMYLIVVGGLFRALVGSSKRRGQIMLIGTLGGLSFGVLLASLLHTAGADKLWVRPDVLDIFAPVGMTGGWAVAWVFARRVPGEVR
jgi:hypothetical protein